jgi:hypothetical protein
MDKLLYIFLWFPVLFAQIPTDYPPVRTREVPDHMQDQVVWLLIIGGILFVGLLVGLKINRTNRSSKTRRL